MLLLGIVMWTIVSALVATLIYRILLFMNELEEKDTAEEIIDHLRMCVVENKCPLGDSALHVYHERIQWAFISRTGRGGVHAVILGEFFFFIFLIVPILFLSWIKGKFFSHPPPLPPPSESALRP